MMAGLPVFCPFNEAGEVRVYVRNLPHWRQPGATYFVTFRQDDSIPAKVLAQWCDERQRWYRAHGLDPRWQRTEPSRFDTAYASILRTVRSAFEREQARQLHHELDQGHGSCVPRQVEPRTKLAEALAFFDGHRLWLGDFVIMPNHCHALILPVSDWELADLLGSIKKWSSREIGLWLLQQPRAVRPNSRRNSKPRFYQQESYDRIVRDAEELAAFRRYIARNAAEAHLPPEAYLYHAAECLDAVTPRPPPP
jgi:type I restriction enzyme R subunit